MQLKAEIHGGAGNDLINGSGNFGMGSYFGDEGNDVLIGGLGKDLLVGGPGTDTIRGQPGDTIINNTAPQPTALRTSLFLASTVAKKKR